MADAAPAPDPFAGGANPFAAIGYADGSAPPAGDPASASPPSSATDDPDALPPLTVTRGPAAAPPQPPSALPTPPISPAAPAPDSSASRAASSAAPQPGDATALGSSSSTLTPADPFAGGANPFAQIGFESDQPKLAASALSSAGPLANSPDDGFLSGMAKNAGTTVIKGLAHGPGFVGDVGEFADALTEIPEYVESKITGQPFADVVAKRNALAAQSAAASNADESGVLGFSLDPRRYFPSGSQVAAPILAKTGAYQPTTALGRFGAAAGEAALGGLGPGGGAIAGGIARDVAPSILTGIGNMARGAAQHALPNALAGVSSQAASDATGGDPLAAALGGIGAGTVAGALHDTFANGPTRKAASVLSQGTADPQAALAAIRGQAAADQIPDFQPTTAQVTQDPGITSMQTRAAGTQARGPQFDARQQQQGRALGSALDALRPGGDPQQVASFFSKHFDDIGDQTQAVVDGHLANGQAQADALRGQGLPVDAYGTSLRGKIADAEDARGTAETALWRAVDPEGRLTNDLFGVKAANAQIYGAMPAADRAFMSPAEGTFSNLIDSYKDVEPFAQVMSLKSNLATAMRQELRENGSSPSYARMSRLMAPVQDAINGTVARKAAADNAAVAAGTMAPEDTLEAFIRSKAPQADTGGNAGSDVGARALGTGTGGSAASSAAAGAGQRQQGRVSGAPSAAGIPSDVPPGSPEAGQIGSVAPGATRPVYYPGGSLGVRNELAEHADLITSHDAAFRPNPNFPQNLQPRARDSAAAQDQVNGMAARLQPQRLGPSPEANAGAPIVGPDNVVESGNGRTMALGKAYDADGAQADAYRQHIQNLGYDTSGYSKPVLIARRITPFEPDQREFFTHAANDATALRMGSAEQAAADASKITPQMLDAQAGPNITTAANRPFVGSFMSKLPAAERGALVDQGGNLSQAGVRRIQAAMTAHAYGDRGVISRAFDDPEPNIKGLAGALTDASGPWAKMRAAVSDGSISPEHDVTPELMQGVKLAMRARDEGRPIGELLAQHDLFQGDTSRLVTAMLTQDGNRIAPRPQIEANLRNYAEEALKNGSGDRLFGSAAPVDDVLKAAQAKAARETGSQPSKLSDGPMFSDVTPAPTANMDAAAAARYKAANAFTKENHAIYGAKPIRDILAEQGGRGNFKTPASAVPGKLFRKGPGGFEDVQAFRRSVGDDSASMHLLRDHALDDLQRVARNPDGTLDDKKLAKWRSDYADALRAYPELSTQLESAGAATRTFTQASAQRRDLIRSYEKSIFGKLMGASHPDEVNGIVGTALQRPDRVAVFRRLTQAVSSDPVALNGLKQAVLEHVVGKSVADIEGETGAARTLKAKQFLDLFHKTQPALREVLGPSATGMLQRIAEMAPRASQAIEGGARQPKNLMRYLESKAKPHEPLLERMWKPALALREFGELGSRLGGEWGEMLAGGAGALAIGKRAVQSLRATGARKVGDIITDALLDPQKYASLLEQAPSRPDTGSAASLANRLKSAAQYGGGAMSRISAHIATRAPRLADRAGDERRRRIREALGTARARGGALGFGSSSPFGLPTVAQMFGPTKKAASRVGFADGGQVRESPDDGAARLHRELEGVRRDRDARSAISAMGPQDPVEHALATAMGGR